MPIGLSYWIVLWASDGSWSPSTRTTSILHQFIVDHGWSHGPWRTWNAFWDLNYCIPIILFFLCNNSLLSTIDRGLFFNPYLTLHNFPSSGQNFIYYGPLSPSSWAKPSTMMMILIIIINIFFFENHYSVIIIMLVKIKERNKVKKRH